MYHPAKRGRNNKLYQTTGIPLLRLDFMDSTNRKSSIKTKAFMSGIKPVSIYLFYVKRADFIYQ